MNIGTQSWLRSHFVSFSASNSRHFMLDTVLEKRSQMTGYWLVTSYFVHVLANLHACGELRHTHAESDSMYAVEPSAIPRAEIEDTYVVSNEITINGTNNLLYFI